MPSTYFILLLHIKVINQRRRIVCSVYLVCVFNPSNRTYIFSVHCALSCAYTYIYWPPPLPYYTVTLTYLLTYLWCVSVSLNVDICFVLVCPASYLNLQFSYFPYHVYKSCKGWDSGKGSGWGDGQGGT